MVSLLRQWLANQKQASEVLEIGCAVGEKSDSPAKSDTAIVVRVAGLALFVP
jgi:hypothetical protein